MIAVSACLAGENCTNNGTNKLVPGIKKLVERKEAVKICPELLGGLPVPREYAEIMGAEGKDVIEGRARVLSKSGRNLTDAFLKGAAISYEIAKSASVNFAVFKSNSPSCGCGRVYNGTFTGRLRQGDGVTTAYFKQKGIKVITEKEWGKK